jgi:galactosamine-6-phosphate isomerase
MNHFVLDTYDDLSLRAAEILMEQLDANPRMLLGAATGSTPNGFYGRLAASARENAAPFSGLRIFKLDEWYGLSMDDPASCEYYLQQRLVQPLRITEDRYFSFDSEAKDPEAECRTIKDNLDREGPLDLCILGLGMNGHIAFNEPASALSPHPHLATLARSSQFNPMVADRAAKPTHGLTVGMVDIFRSKTILLLISGAPKKDIVQNLFSQRISTAFPASLLWLHPNTICLLDRAAWGS